MIFGFYFHIFYDPKLENDQKGKKMWAKMSVKYENSVGL